MPDIIDERLMLHIDVQDHNNEIPKKPIAKIREFVMLEELFLETTTRNATQKMPNIKDFMNRFLRKLFMIGSGRRCVATDYLDVKWHSFPPR